MQFTIVGLNSTFTWAEANGVAAKYTTQVLVQHAKNDINSPSTDLHLVHFGVFFFFFFLKKKKLFSLIKLYFSFPFKLWKFLIL